MACIKKRRNRWVVDYRIAGIRKTPSFENRAEAEAFKRNLLLRPIDQITDFHQVKEISLTEAVQKYFDQVTPTKAPRTWDVDHRALNALVEHFPGRLVNEVTLMDLEAYQLKRSRIVSPSSVNRHFNVIRHFFRKCEDWNFIKEKPTRKLTNLKAESNPRKLWTRENVIQFFAKAPDWLQDVAFFIYETGVRRGEAVSLKWKDVDFDKNAVRIKSIKGGIARERMIPMTNSMRDWFLQKRNSNPFLAKAEKSVFLNEEGETIHPTFLSTAVHRVVKKLGLEGLGLHGMRHTILTELVQSDVSLEKVRQLAGHSNLKTTEKYLHLKIDDTRSMLETLNEKRDVIRPFQRKFGTGGS